MDNPDGYYRQMAAECLRLAEATSDIDGKTMLLEIAQTWVKLDNYLSAKTARESV